MAEFEPDPTKVLPDELELCEDANVAAEIFFVVFFIPSIYPAASRDDILESLLSDEDEEDMADEPMIHTPEIEISTSPEMSKLNFRSTEPNGRKPALRRRSLSFV